jgi:hypothetical protein
MKPLRLDKSRLVTYPLAERPSKVNLAGMAGRFEGRETITEFIAKLPGFLAANDLRELIELLVERHRRGRRILLGMGAHAIKVGLNPLLIELLERKILDGIALNGAGIIHDFELALAGHTSEDVSEGINGGNFGMARETGERLNRAIIAGIRDGLGIGAAVGRMIEEEKLPHRDSSLLARGWRRRVPITVHVAIGTDIIHMHPAADGAAIGKGSLADFDTFCALVAGLDDGVYINLGSAVVLPEVFLKAITLARNLGHPVAGLTTVNMDFIRHYRATENVVRRPTMKEGRGITLIGHHEIMFPLLVAGVLGRLEGEHQEPQPGPRT